MARPSGIGCWIFSSLGLMVRPPCFDAVILCSSIFCTAGEKIILPWFDGQGLVCAKGLHCVDVVERL
jgi:hypothetical protein